MALLIQKEFYFYKKAHQHWALVMFKNKSHPTHFNITILLPGKYNSIEEFNNYDSGRSGR